MASPRVPPSTTSAASAFANWAYKVAEQEEQLGVFFDTIIVCTVTGSTHAGMIAGFAALEDAGGRPRRVPGIDASATLGGQPALNAYSGIFA
jgi:1-aminocyclopropane-1-carboxylate deaminase/D-cysteine desulfhydrase-like pyridoxal-dependent ACC family enzyme